MLGIKAFLVDVISESIAKGLIAVWHEITAKHTAEREKPNENDYTRANRFLAAVSELQRPQGDSRSEDPTPALPPL